MYDDKDKGELVLVMEGEVGKMATKQVGDTPESITLFVSLLRARPDTQFKIMRLSLTDAILALADKCSSG